MHPDGTQVEGERDRTHAIGWKDRRAAAVLVLVAAGYSLAAGSYLPALPGWAFVLLGAVAAGVAHFSRGLLCRTLLCLAVFALSAGWFRARCDESPRDDLSRLLTTESRLVRVEGRVLESPELRASGAGEFARFEHHASGAWHFDFRVFATIDDQGEPAPASGILRVRATQEPATVRAGERAVLRGFARAVPPPKNPGEPDRPRLARQGGVTGYLDIPSPTFVSPVTDPPLLTDRAARLWARASERLRSLTLGSLSPPDAPTSVRADESASLLRAMLLGQRDDELRDLSGAFTRVGLAHVLSVSGMNLTLLAWFALMALRLLGDHPRLEKLAVGALVFAYLVVVPAEAPIVRAAIMIGVFLLAEWGGRRYDRLNTLAWAAVLSLLWRPMDLWSPGFQLSYLGVAALISLAQPLRHRLFGEPPGEDFIGGGLRALLIRALELVKTGFAATLCAWAITTPAVIWHTGVVSPIGPIANMIVWPMVSAVTGLGYALVLAGTVVPASTAWAVPALHWLGDAFASAVRLLDTVPGGVWYLPRVSAWWCFAATAALAWLMALPRFNGSSRPPPGSVLRRRPGARIIIPALLAAWLGAEVWLRPTLPTNVREVLVLHIPGGSCAALRSGRETVLYGCGSSWGGAGQRLIPRALRSAGVASVSRVIVPCADTGVYNALLDVVRPLGVREVLVGEQFMRQAGDIPDGPAAHLIARLGEMGVRVRAVSAGDSLPLGTEGVRVLSPSAGSMMPTLRDASLVVSFGPQNAGAPGEHALLLGEIGRPGFDALTYGAERPTAGLVVVPRTGWVATRPERVRRWASSGGESPLLVFRGTPQTGSHDDDESAVDLTETGFISARWTAVKGWTVSPPP